MSEFKSFEDLIFWQEAREFRLEVTKTVRSFPSEEKWRLSDQLIRSSRSITSNIAEGHGRYHYQENIQFCRVARGSLCESWDHLLCAHDENLINQHQLEEFRAQFMKVLKVGNGYISYLKKRKKRRDSI